MRWLPRGHEGWTSGRFGRVSCGPRPKVAKLCLRTKWILTKRKMSSTSMIVVTSIISGIIMLLLAYTCAYDPSSCMLHVHIRDIILLCENKIAQDLCVVCR